MNGRRLLWTVLLGWSSAMAATAQVRMVYDTIPFEIVQDKFIFQASIDGKPVRMILDTGGQNILVSDSADYYGVTIIRNQTIADVNDSRIQTQMGSVKNFRVGRWMNWNVGKVTVVPNNPFFRELGVVGAVGGEMFGHVCLSIDRRNRRFTVAHPYRPNNISRSAGTPMDAAGTNHAIVPVTFGSEQLDVLFDTGASGFLSLSAGDFDKLSAQPGNIEVQEAGHGTLYVGVAGIEKAVKDSVYKMRIPSLRLPGGKELRNVGTLVGQHPSTIAGQRFFDQGIVMLDYPRGLFYFFPYEEGPSDVAAETRVWNVKILPLVDRVKMEGKFEVVATFGSVDVAVGERVWAINGTELDTAKLSESVVNGLLDGVEGDRTMILVGPDKKQLRKVEIEKI